MKKIGLPLETAIRLSPEGIPYLAPEIQLLYKAQPVRPEVQADFERIVPRLDGPSLAWLQAALATVDPAHQWLSALNKPPNGSALI